MSPPENGKQLQILTMQHIHYHNPVTFFFFFHFTFSATQQYFGSCNPILPKQFIGDDVMFCFNPYLFYKLIPHNVFGKIKSI